MIFQIFSIVFPIFAIVLAGYLYGRRHSPDMSAANKLNIEIFTPALIFDVLIGKDFDPFNYLGLALSSVAIVVGSLLLAWPVARLLGYRFRTFVPPMMFSNSGNMGLPLALLAFGEHALPAAVVLFITMNLLHFSLGFKIMDSEAPLSGLLRIPMLIATFLGLLVGQSGISLPEVLTLPIGMLGQISIPLMLFALGVRLIHVNRRDWQIGAVGAIVRPLTGVLIAILMGLLLNLPQAQFNLLVVFGSLPPAVLNFMVAERFQQEPQKVASIVLIGNVASILFVPLALAYALTPAAG
jgi:predicted permease